MRRNLRSASVGALKKALRRRRRERMQRVCCETCLRHVPGRFGRAETLRPTARAAALRDQAINSCPGRTHQGMTFTPAHKPAGTPAGGQFTATAHAEPDHIHLIGLRNEPFEDAIQQIAFHTMASNRWKDEATDGLMGRGSFDRSQLCIAAWRAVDRAGLREIEAAGLYPEMYEFRDRGMDRYEKHLPAALEMVEAEYRKG